MALINDIYVFIETEDVKRVTQASEHPVEEGIDLTDCVRRSPISLSLSGELVGSGYEDDLSALEQMQKDGELVEYTGIHMISQSIITSFQTSHSGMIRGGCKFTMEIKEIRIASSPFTEGSGNTGTQQIEESQVPAVAAQQRTHTVKSGDTLWNIAASYYGSGGQFSKIFEANRDKLSNPDKINTGQKLVIP